MSWNKNTVVRSHLDAIVEVLKQTGTPYEISVLAEVQGQGLNDGFIEGGGPYLIRRLVYGETVVLEQMVRHPDCDCDDYLDSFSFTLDTEPKDWKPEITLEWEEPD